MYPYKKYAKSYHSSYPVKLVPFLQALTVSRGYITVFKDEDENYYVMGPAQLYFEETYSNLADAIASMRKNWALHKTFGGRS